MHNFFTSRFFRLTLLVAFIANAICAVSLTRQVRAEERYITYLPIITRDAIGGTASPPPTETPEQQALNRINYYRAMAGAPLLRLHPALLASAQNHAHYYLLNYADSTAMIYGPHGEVAGKSGYTGQWPGDRFVAVGYPWASAGGGEVMHFLDDPTLSADVWMATIFHRLGLIDPYFEYMGYGHGTSGTGRVDVVDLAHGTSDTDRTQLIVFPAAQQTNVPLAGAAEAPSPLPPGAPYTFGYPVTIQPAAFSQLVVTQAELKGPSGATVAVYPNPSGCGTACYALIPIAPLLAATSYTAHVVGTVDGKPFERTWSFTTVR